MRLSWKLNIVETGQARVVDVVLPDEDYVNQELAKGLKGMKPNHHCCFVTGLTPFTHCFYFVVLLSEQDQ